MLGQQGIMWAPPFNAKDSAIIIHRLMPSRHPQFLI
jgi:hypothetical protein